MTYVQLDVGQGDAAVFHLPRGKTVLVDGGPVSTTFNAGERIIAPYLHHRGIRTLDAVILTHAHSDHVGGLAAVLESFQVHKVILSDSSSHSPIFKNFLDVARKRRIPTQMITAPDSLVLEGVIFYLISPDSLMAQDDNPNNQSVVTLICHGKDRILLTGDAEVEAETHMIHTIHPLHTDLMKVGHHGSYTASSEAFIQNVKPKAVIISVGEKNRFGHPSAEILKRYETHGVQVLRTDHEGAVIYQSDGRGFLRVEWQ